MASKSMFTAAQIALLLPDIVDTLCPFELTQDGKRYQIEYRPREKPQELYVIGHGFWSFSIFSVWFHRGDLVNGKPFDAWYDEQFGIHFDDVEALL